MKTVQNAETPSITGMGDGSSLLNKRTGGYLPYLSKDDIITLDATIDPPQIDDAIVESPILDDITVNILSV
jgi:hypothetical protein